MLQCCVYDGKSWWWVQYEHSPIWIFVFIIIKMTFRKMFLKNMENSPEMTKFIMKKLNVELGHLSHKIFHACDSNLVSIIYFLVCMSRHSKKNPLIFQSNAKWRRKYPPSKDSTSISIHQIQIFKFSPFIEFWNDLHEWILTWLLRRFFIYFHLLLLFLLFLKIEIYGAVFALFNLNKFGWKFCCFL